MKSNHKKYSIIFKNRKKGKGNKEQMGQTESNSKMTDVNPTISMVTLNVND